MQDQQPFDARDMAVALVQQLLALAAETALVLLYEAWHTHDTAHLFLPAHERQQYAQRSGIKPVRLCTPRPASTRIDAESSTRLSMPRRSHSAWSRREWWWTPSSTPTSS